MAGVSSGGLALSITPERAVQGGEPDDICVLCSITTPQGSSRTPTDVCCIIDISWSMSALAAGDKDESGGLSLLDVAKHAVRTIIRTMGAEDRLSIVSFCSEAETVLELTKMDAEGQDTAERSLEQIGYGSGTALWEGLRSGLDSMQKGEGESGRFRHIMLLTDGVASDKDVVMPGLKECHSNWGRLPCAIHTFGFGYEIDSKLLLEVAEFSCGSYAFIPDAGFVGTAFVNAISNLFVTMAADVRLNVSAQSGASITEVMGGWKLETPAAESESPFVNLGALQYGQTKDVVLRMKMPPRVAGASAVFLAADLTCSLKDGRGRVECAAALPMAPAAADLQRVEHQKCRSLFVSSVLAAARSAEAASLSDDDMRKLSQYANLSDNELEQACETLLQESNSKLKELTNMVQASPLSKQSGDPVAALLEDIVGQTMEAFSRLEYFRKWGRHYVVSIANAHRSQQCINFKDPGVQVYGGELFNNLRDDADDTFNTLAAPKPTHGQYRYVLGGWRNGRLQPGKVIHNPDYRGPGAFLADDLPREQAPVVNMADFNDRYCA
mmetsp:Transcript_61297/g.145950  ORF Transcript_61297/g.145950 Transcript_61297/m.145950 type:complete len:554 (-) Transcript_61297:108-1769(-)